MISIFQQGFRVWQCEADVDLQLVPPELLFYKQISWVLFSNDLSRMDGLRDGLSLMISTVTGPKPHRFAVQGFKTTALAF